MPQSTGGHSVGPGQHGSAPASPSFPPSILRKTQLRNTSTQTAGQRHTPRHHRAPSEEPARPGAWRAPGEQSPVGLRTAPRPPVSPWHSPGVQGEAEGRGRLLSDTRHQGQRSILTPLSPGPRQDGPSQPRRPSASCLTGFQGEAAGTVRGVAPHGAADRVRCGFNLPREVTHATFCAAQTSGIGSPQHAHSPHKGLPHIRLGRSPACPDTSSLVFRGGCPTLSVLRGLGEACGDQRGGRVRLNPKGLCEGIRNKYL